MPENRFSKYAPATTPEANRFSKYAVPGEVGAMAVPTPRPDKSSVYARDGYDQDTGGTYKMRFLAGSAPNQESALASLKATFPKIEAFVTEFGDLAYVNPMTGKKTIVNPPGFDTGDIASIAPEAGGMAGGLAGAVGGAKAGGALGAAVGGPAAPVTGAIGAVGGALIGAGLGAAGGTELARIPARFAGMKDTRTPKQVAQDMAIEASLSMIGEAAGPAGTFALKAATKPMIRSAKTAQEAVRVFDTAGTAPKFDEMARSIPTALARGLEMTPGGQAAWRAARERQEDEIQRSVMSLVSNIAGGRDVGALAAGQEVKAGIVDNFLPQFKAQTARNFDDVKALAQDQYIQPTATIAKGNEFLNPAPGWPGATRVGKYADTESAISAIKADMKAAKKQGLPGISYDALDIHRKSIGAMLDDVGRLGNPANGQLKALYDNILDDMANSLAASGNMDALTAFNKARAEYQRGRALYDDFLKPLETQNLPERIFSTLRGSMKEGPTYIENTLKSLNPDQIKILQASIIQRAGRATAAQNDETGMRWTLDRFLTEWDGYDKAAKDALFPKATPLRKDLDDMAKAAAIARRSAKFIAGPSGTTQAREAVAGPLAIGGAIVTGQPMLAAAIFGALYAAPYLGLKVINNPRMVKLLAATPKIRPAGFGAWAGQFWAAAEGEDDATKAEIRQFIVDAGNRLNEEQANQEKE